MMTPQKKDNVVYIYSKPFLNAFQPLVKYNKRAHLVHHLIAAYGLLENLNVINPKMATVEELLKFHTEEYINFLKKVDCIDDDDEFPEEAEEFGLCYDCPIVPGLFKTVSWLGGGSLTAAREILNESCKVAINWGGGWHHSKKDEAAGFCYINDIVLAILELRTKFDKVLYLDFDLHHGDGVEEAFAFTSKVLCFSVHKYSDGFYPGTGSMESVGYGKGRYYTINVPLKDGIRDEAYKDLIIALLENTHLSFVPDCVVCQFGADVLHGDPMESFNLTLNGLGCCLETVLSWKKPLLLLGGGGYNPANVARCWAYLTSIVCGKKLNNDIPTHNYFLEYGPDYELHILPGNRSDLNVPQYLTEISSTLNGYLRKTAV